MVPVSQGAREKPQLQQGTALPVVPTACPTCNPEAQVEGSRWRCDPRLFTVGIQSGNWDRDSGEHRGVGEGPLPLQTGPPCCAHASSLTLLSRAGPGIQGSWSGGPQGDQPQPHPDHMLSHWAPPGGRKSV
ncbi:unnamed protein product [Rangifer tarandus platyrhynchus]|uniref:Uncharacterized protein n=1 Tax=Rangifer tarandus platyrhynchus TaxID=3082113 RepID=A0ABN8ZNT9_RANTA|nr:unnamed protein product [Rangifer tarandus platyrhynchus]